MNNVKVPPDTFAYTQCVPLDKLKWVVGLRLVIYAYHVKSGLGVSSGSSARLAVQVQQEEQAFAWHDATISRCNNSLVMR